MPIDYLPASSVKRMSWRLGAAIVSCAVLAACQAPEAEAVEDPNYVNVTIAEGSLTGSYNPASFDEEIARQALAASCTGGEVATYQEGPGEDGLVNFAATCVGGTSQPDGTYSFQRRATRPATIEEAAMAEEAVTGM
ncbi:hypothetical protein MLD63_16270 [Paracoccus sp. TK19116]|uniref:Uncharacterized protein n=1 Tax=Paracoccus albicereus TaxID=2922394 RepID=A0ABT1MV23_9RHOB|nr:hypothetical protein [Paracoccus albicereus]MCQ0971979.1 hypothetical protein [Paracoccus albicereus]